MAKSKVKDGNMISFNPETFTSGGLFDDEDAKVTEAGFEIWDYGGKADREATALRIKLETKDGTEVEQYWSVGDPEVYWPNADGKWIISTKSALNAASNFAIFLSMLISGAGFPLDRIEGDIGGLVGLDAHWMRVPPPKKRSVKKSTDDEGRERQDLVLVVSKINALPGEGGKGKARGKAAATKTPAKDADENVGDDDIETACVSAVNMALTSANAPIPKKSIAKEAFGYLPKDWDKTTRDEAVMQRIFNDKWLGEHPTEWSYEGGIITAV